MAAGESDEQLAERLANAAGAILLALRASGLVGKRLGKAGDEAANAMLCREIRAARPADAILSAEEQDNAARCGHSRVWIIDPLAGTRPEERRGGKAGVRAQRTRRALYLENNKQNNDHAQYRYTTKIQQQNT